MEITIIALLITLNIAMFVIGPLLIFLLQKQIKGDSETKEMYEDMVLQIKDNFEKEENFMKQLNTNEKINTSIFEQISTEFLKMGNKVSTVGDDILKHTGREDGRWESIDNYLKEIYKVACLIERDNKYKVDQNYTKDIRQWKKGNK